MTIDKKIEGAKTRYEIFRAGDRKSDKQLHKSLLREFYLLIKELQNDLNKENEKALENLNNWLETFEIYNLEQEFNQLEDS